MNQTVDHDSRYRLRKKFLNQIFEILEIFERIEHLKKFVILQILQKGSISNRINPLNVMLLTNQI